MEADSDKGQAIAWFAGSCGMQQQQHRIYAVEKKPVKPADLPQDLSNACKRAEKNDRKTSP